MADRIISIDPAPGSLRESFISAVIALREKGAEFLIIDTNDQPEPPRFDFGDLSATISNVGNEPPVVRPPRARHKGESIMAMMRRLGGPKP